MIARLNINQPVIGILGAAENMPGPDAMRPGDIIKSHSENILKVLTQMPRATYLSRCDQYRSTNLIRHDYRCCHAYRSGNAALGHEIAAVLGNDETLISSL